MLRIATTQIYQQGARTIGERQVALARIQQQLATGKRILEHADDPAGSARLLGLREELALNDQYQRNIDLANGRLNLEETALREAGEIFQRARELTVQANNAPLQDGDRSAIAKEIRQLREQMVDLGNTQDGNGEYLFAGFKSRTLPFVANGNSVSYQGDQGQRLIKAGPSLDIPVGDSGAEVFQVDSLDPSKGWFATLDRLATALETPADTPAQQAQLQASLANSLSELDQGLEHLRGIRSGIGARLNALEGQQNVNGDFAVQLQQTISDLGDLDYAGAATRLSQETLVLQAAQQAFLRVQGLTLFNTQ